MISTILANYSINENIHYIGDNENENFANFLNKQQPNTKYFNIETHNFRIMEPDMSNAFGSKKIYTSYNLKVMYKKEVLHERNMSTNNTKKSGKEIKDNLTLIGNNYSKFIKTAIRFNKI